MGGKKKMAEFFIPPFRTLPMNFVMWLFCSRRNLLLDKGNLSWVF